MANKYIIHGATFNGDGTTSSEAASNGAAGAWNTITYFEGTAPAYGTLVAGDVVYIRSKDSGGADITRTLSVLTNLGSAAGTANNPISWILDNGVIWSGVNGILKYQNSANTNRPVFRENNYFKSAANNLRYATTATGTSAGDGLPWMEVKGVVEGLHFDTSTYPNTSPRHYIQFADGGTLINPILKIGARSSGSDSAFSLFSMSSNRGDIYLINPDIELVHSGVGGGGLFGVQTSYQRNTYVSGGRVYGTGANTAGQPVVVVTSPNGGFVKCVGFQFPREMIPVSGTWGASSSTAGTHVEIIGCDNGLGGHHEACWGWMTSRTDNNPPYLAAESLDTAATPWAWRVYPSKASMQSLMAIQTAKMYTDATGTKTITQRMLIANTMSPTKENLWIAVSYTDSNDIPRSECSKAFGTLDTDDAGWSAVVWGSVSFNKYKLTVTTAYSIKQDSVITVNLFGFLKSATTNDIYFVDPDFSVD